MTYVTVDVDVSLDEFSDDAIAAHLRSQGYTVIDDDISKPKDELIQEMYELYRNNKPIDAQLRKLFYTTLGRIV